MIEWETYEKLVIEHLSHKISSSDNPDHHQAISAPTEQSQFLVAGPGSGKTTVITFP